MIFDRPVAYVCYNIVTKNHIFDLLALPKTTFWGKIAEIYFAIYVMRLCDHMNDNPAG